MEELDLSQKKNDQIQWFQTVRHRSDYNIYPRNSPSSLDHMVFLNNQIVQEFQSLPFWHTFPCYIFQSWCCPYHTRVGQIRRIPSCPIQHFLKPSTSSYKAARSLFRRHFHINVARELVGSHLMRRQQLFRDICCPSPFLSLIQRLTLSDDVTPK